MINITSFKWKYEQSQLQSTEIITGYNQIMSMVSCNKIMDISYYMSEASPVISDEIDIGHTMLCKRGMTS